MPLAPIATFFKLYFFKDDENNFNIGNDINDTDKIAYGN